MNKYINRSIEKTLANLIGRSPVIMISGPRQVGKTTLLDYLLTTSDKAINKVSLDNTLLRTQAIKDPELFLRTHDTPLIIDEFQYAPELLSYIKIKVDEARKNAMFASGEEVGTLYYLTGSQVFETMETISESLAGRVSILDLYGFSTRELNGLCDEAFLPEIDILKKKKLKSLSIDKIFERIFNGSYPEITVTKLINREQFYEDYIRTYIERDIRKVINIKDEYKFIRFISSIAARTSQEYNASEIADDIEIDTKTVDNWLSILKNTNLIYMLQPYSNNTLSKAIKRPKIYFMDTGLACYLAGYMNVDTLIKSVYSRAIFETYIISEIIKSFANNGYNAKRYLYYYRDTNQKEIDLIIDYDNKLYPVEIKKSANPGISAIKNFNVLNKPNINLGNGIVLCITSSFYALDDNNYLVPIEYI